MPSYILEYVFSCFICFSREIKDVQFLPEKLSQKSAKELFDYCQKAEQDYKHLISGKLNRVYFISLCLTLYLVHQF